MNGSGPSTRILIVGIVGVLVLAVGGIMLNVRTLSDERASDPVGTLSPIVQVDAAAPVKPVPSRAPMPGPTVNPLRAPMPGPTVDSAPKTQPPRSDDDDRTSDHVDRKDSDDD